MNQRKMIRPCDKTMRVQIIDLEFLGYKIFQQLSICSVTRIRVHVGVLQIPDTKNSNILTNFSIVVFGHMKLTTLYKCIQS